MAYRGDWKAYFDYIADVAPIFFPERQAKRRSIRTWIYVGYDRTEPFLSPYLRTGESGRICRHLHVSITGYIQRHAHSYIIELKYAKGKDSDEKVEQLRQEAITQANRYAASETVQKAIGTTTLHKIIVVYQGMKMVVCEEV